MSISLKTHGIPNRAEKVRRTGKNYHENNIKVASKSPSLNTNIFPKNDYEKLGLLAEKLAIDCYALKPSKKLIRDFIVALERIRGA